MGSPIAWIGTSGYVYPHWVGVLYPEGLPSRRWLAHYAQHFNAVELNVTFYRLPDPKIFQEWREQVPGGFRFILKGSRFITHVRRLRDVDEAVVNFFLRAEPIRERLGGVLWQLPPRFRADPARLAAFCRTLPPSVRHAFEFRDASWFTDAVFAHLQALDAAVVAADWPYQVLLPDMEPEEIPRPVVRVPHTARWAYVRRHGPGAVYGSRYPDAMIRRDAAWVRAQLRAGREVYVFYNNDVAGHAVRDALALRRLVAGEDDGKRP